MAVFFHSKNTLLRCSKVIEKFLGTFYSCMCVFTVVVKTQRKRKNTVHVLLNYGKRRDYVCVSRVVFSRSSFDGIPVVVVKFKTVHF